MSTADRFASGRGPYVTREVCETLHAEQREANRRTWDELRGLRRLVILLVVGGQLFSGGVNLAGVGYWLRAHEGSPHPGTVEMVEKVRGEVREDLRDLRREVKDLVATLMAPRDGANPRALSDEGGNP
ncbi:MAG TPA: hypothetical protein VFH53_10550 [Phycisphaerae bacterium]|nr:hypothetical protein [Phycisphaerae bacterium]HUX17050.1 hypothetical protein [Phycisphaerae bacterium]